MTTTLSTKQRGRQQAPGEVGPERREVDAPRALEMSEQGPRDQEAGDDEEHVHATRDPAEPDVLRGDQQCRYGAQPLALWAAMLARRHPVIRW